MRSLFIPALIACASCGPIAKPQINQPFVNLSTGLAAASLAVVGDKCIGEFQAHSGHNIRPELPMEFCKIVEANIHARNRQQPTQAPAPASAPETEDTEETPRKVRPPRP